MNRIAILSLKKSCVTAGLPRHLSIILQSPGPCAPTSRTAAADHGALCQLAAVQGDARHRPGHSGMSKVWLWPTLTPRLGTGPSSQICCLFTHVSWTSSKSEATEIPELQVGAWPAGVGLQPHSALTRELWHSWVDTQTPHLACFGNRTTRSGRLNGTISPWGSHHAQQQQQSRKNQTNQNPTEWSADCQREPSLCKMLQSSALVFYGLGVFFLAFGLQANQSIKRSQHRRHQLFADGV